MLSTRRNSRTYCLLSVRVGGLLGNKEFALSIGSLWDYGTYGDLNDSTDTGLYVGEIDKTDNIPARDTFLVVVFANNIYAIQIAYALNSNEVYQRRILKYLNKIYDWVKIN